MTRQSSLSARWPIVLAGVACWSAPLAGGCDDAIVRPIRLVDSKAGAEPGPGMRGAGVDTRRDAGRDAEVVGLGAFGDDGFTADGEVPDTIYCAPAANWPQGNADLELQILDAIAALRDTDAFECGDFVGRDLEPLVLVPELRCSARIHSVDMVERNFFEITNPDGESPRARMTQAGRAPSRWGELIERGGDVAQVVAHLTQENRFGCRNLTSPDYHFIGVGYHNSRWTIDLSER